MLSHFYKKAFFTSFVLLFRPRFAALYSNMSQGLEPEYSVAYVTVPNQEVAKTIARGLVTNKLAACVNIIPQVTSIYDYKNDIHEDNELLLMIKTRTSQVDNLTAFVRSNHPYEVCEVISQHIQKGNPEYLKWIGDTVPAPKD